MRYRSKVNRSIIVVILSLFLCNFVIKFARSTYLHRENSKNQKEIEAVVSSLLLSQQGIDDDLKALYPLLQLKGLNDNQKSQIYFLITNLCYQKGDMKKYFENVGNALFYTERVGYVDGIIYLYAAMAKYFLEIGNDELAYEIINTAESFRSFYDCQHVLTRIQALQVYSSYLLSIAQYEKAFVAASQIIADSPLTEAFNPDFPRYFEGAGNAIKARILMMQGRFAEAGELADSLLEKYAGDYETVSRFNAFDFYMPLYEVKITCAVNAGKFEKAVEYNKKYGEYCNLFFFKNKKMSMSGFLMNALPPEMAAERRMLFNQLSEDSRSLVKNLIDDYTYLANSKFSSTMTELRLESEISEKNNKTIQSLLFNAFIFVVLILLCYAVFSEARTDGLTKLFTRKSLNFKLRLLEMFKTNYSAVMIDLDDFKKINDTYGHEIGDEVLKAVSGLVLDAERRHVKAYRYGGEEIMVIFEHTAFEDVIRQSESIRTKICKLRFASGVRVTASFGVGTKPDNPVSQADENMYYAKSKGKNIVAYKINDRQYLAERRLEIRNPMPDTVKK